MSSIVINGTTLMNCTPHPIALIGKDGETVALAKGTVVPRVAVINEEVGSVGNIQLFRSTYGAVEGLPGPVENTVLIVSMLVRIASGARTDLASPGVLTRDPEGKIIGATGLSVN